LNFYFFQYLQLGSVIPISPQPQVSLLRQPTAASDVISRTEITNHIRILDKQLEIFPKLTLNVSDFNHTLPNYSLPNFF